MIPSEDELEGEYIPALFGAFFCFGVIALLTNSALFAIFAIVLFALACRKLWRDSQLDWDFGLEDESDEVRKA